MTVHSIEQALSDSNAVVAIAQQTGIAISAVRRMLAVLADMDAQQVVRMMATARADQIRQINRGRRVRR